MRNVANNFSSVLSYLYRFTMMNFIFFHVLDLKFLRSPKNKTVHVNDRLRLRCRVTGNPWPDVVFLWNGKPIPKNEPGKSIKFERKYDKTIFRFCPLSDINV